MSTTSLYMPVCLDRYTCSYTLNTLNTWVIVAKEHTHIHRFIWVMCISIYLSIQYICPYIHI